MRDGFREPNSIRAHLERDSRVQVRAFLNPWLSADHSKVWLMDDQVVFVGGMNFGREYRYEWPDLMVELRGPVVDQLAADFRLAWSHAGLAGDLGRVVEGQGAGEGLGDALQPRSRLAVDHAVEARPGVDPKRPALRVAGQDAVLPLRDVQLVPEFFDQHHGALADIFQGSELGIPACRPVLLHPFDESEGIFIREKASSAAFFDLPHSRIIPPASDILLLISERYLLFSPE